MSIRNNTVGTTEITPVETEVTKSKKQESRDFSRGRFKQKRGVVYCPCCGETNTVWKRYWPYYER